MKFKKELFKKQYIEDGIYYDSKSKNKITGFDENYEFGSEICIPSTVEFILYPGFKNLNAPSSTLIIESSKNKKTIVVEPGAFENAKLEKVVFEEGINAIYSNSFSSSDIETFILPKSMIFIGSNAFLNSNVKHINLENIETIGPKAFANSKIEDVNLDNLKFELPPSIFASCEYLKHVSIGKKTKTPIQIEFDAFSGCIKLKDVELGNVDEINTNAFGSTISLETIIFPPSLKKIGSTSFNKSGLTSVKIPPSVTYIGNSAFKDCFNLEDVQIEEGTVLEIDYTAFAYTPIKNLTLPSSAVKLSVHALSKMPELETLTVNSNVTSLPQSFAYNCPKLRNVFLNPSIKTLEINCFERSGIEYIGNNFKNIEHFGKACFRGCSSLTKILIENNAKVEIEAFAECENLHAVCILTDDINDDVFGLTERPDNAKFYIPNSDFLKLKFQNVHRLTTDFMDNFRDITSLRTMSRLESSMIR